MSSIFSETKRRRSTKRLQQNDLGAQDVIQRRRVERTAGGKTVYKTVSQSLFAPVQEETRDTSMREAENYAEDHGSWQWNTKNVQDPEEITQKGEKRSRKVGV